MDVIRRVIPAVIASLAAFGQGQPEFEVASIRPSAPITTGQVKAGVHIDGARIICNFLSLKDYIGMAYRVKMHQISGPDWLGSARFDITATLPPGVARDKVSEMLQVLLAERFQLKLHRDKKEFPVYGLVPGKGGLKMKESPADSGADSAEGGKEAVNVTATGGRGGTTINFGKGSYFTVANNRFEGTKLSMASLADTLGRFVDRPIVDMTELKGNYDFALEFSPEDFRAMMIRSAIAAGAVLPPEAMQAMQSASGDSLFTALQTVGLKLTPSKAPIEVLVIDHVERAPTDN